MAKMEHVKNFYRLVHKIKDNVNSKTKPKRHGEYVTLEMFDGFSLLLDTWSSAISVFRNGKKYDYLGMDFGGFKSKDVMVKFWAAHIP